MKSVSARYLQSRVLASGCGVQQRPNNTVRCPKPSGKVATAFTEQSTRCSTNAPMNLASLSVAAKKAPKDLQRFCATYLLGIGEPDGVTRDPVARFYPNNGARLDRLNPAGDISDKGLK